jgi:hypothetical protein
MEKAGQGRGHELEEAEEEPTYTITQINRDYSDPLEYGDVAIKFRLPELMGTILDESRKNCLS